MITKKKLIKICIAVSLVSLIFVLRKLDVDLSLITIERFREAIRSLGFFGPLVYILFYILRPLILLPAVIVSAAAGAIWGMKGFIYLQIAANLSAIIEFFIARYMARDMVEKFIKGKAERVDALIEKGGFWAVLLVRLVPNVMWDIQNLVLGLTKVRFKDYFLATLIGILPFSFAVVYFGSSFTSILLDPKHFGRMIVSIVLFVCVYILQQVLRKQQHVKYHHSRL